MSKYNTKQRSVLLEFLSSHTDEYLSAKEIAANLEKEGISTSAVYRNLAELEEEGKIKKSVKTGSREAVYQYTDDKHCRENLHLICKHCGKICHLGDEETEKITCQLANCKHFQLDKADTVLYGICEKCNK